MQRLKRCGTSSVAFSLDGASPKRHDRVRGVPGTFQRTLHAIDWALESGLPVQVNTLVAAETLDDLEAVYRLVRALGAQRWALFFLIGVGRGSVLSEIRPHDCERVLEWAYLYRFDPLFSRLRDPDALNGKSGRCEFRRICGGSRARAYATSGDPLGSDPLCVYQPGRQTAKADSALQ